MANLRSRIVDLREVDTADLKDNEGNWRAHPLAQRNALATVLHDVGIVDALLVYESIRQGGLTLLDGHLRAGNHPGKWPVLFLDLDDAEADVILASFDPLAAMAQTIPGALADLVEQAKTGATGDMQDVLDQMVADAGAELALLDGQMLVDPGPDIQRAQELIAKWGVHEGDIWQCGDHLIACGDCREEATWERLLAAVGAEKANGVFTSPPYAMQRGSQYGGVPADEYVEWWGAVQANVGANLAADGSFFVNIKPHCKGGERALYTFDLVLAMQRRWGWRFVDELIWYKPGLPGGWNNRFRNDFEPVFAFAQDSPVTVYLQVADDVGSSSSPFVSETAPVYHFSGRRKIQFYPRAMGTPSSSIRVYASSNPGTNPNTGNITVGGAFKVGVARPGNVVRVSGNKRMLAHSAVFPVGLPTFFIESFSAEGDLWVDPFLGSGSTVVAAHQSKRRGLGIEKLPRYVAVALERLAGMGLSPQLRFFTFERED